MFAMLTRDLWLKKESAGSDGARDSSESSPQVRVATLNLEHGQRDEADNDDDDAKGLIGRRARSSAGNSALSLCVAGAISTCFLELFLPRPETAPLQPVRRG